MMRKFAGIMLLVFVAVCLQGFGGKAPTSPTVIEKPSAQPVQIGTTAPKAGFPYLIDNFEDGTYTEAPEWFVFDNIIPSVEKNSRLKDGDQKVVGSVGDTSLKLRGATSSWYVGGIGSVLSVDASQYTTVELDIYGYGENSGKFKVELYDDDNGNAEIEVDPSWKPLYDDLYVVEVAVDWSGWKHVSLPVSEFAIEGRGNKKFDPSIAGGSSGLAKVQIVCVANEESGSVKFNLDNFELGIR